VPAEKIGRSSEGAAEGGCGGGNSAAPEPEAKPHRPARSEQSSAKKFSLPFRRKNWWRAKIKNCEENFFAGWRASASGDGAERQFRSKKVRISSNKRTSIKLSDFLLRIISLNFCFCDRIK